MFLTFWVALFIEICAIIISFFHYLYSDFSLKERNKRIYESDYMKDAINKMANLGSVSISLMEILAVTFQPVIALDAILYGF